MIMDGAYKYIYCETDPPLLFDRANDPHEKHNLAGQKATAEIEARLAAYVADNWDMTALKQKVIASQVQRRVVDRAHNIGLRPSWDYDPAQPSGQQYFRPSEANPSASNYNTKFEVRARSDSECPNTRKFP